MNEQITGKYIRNEQIIKQEKPDSVEIRETAKHELTYTIVIHFDSDNKIEDLIERVNKVKDAVENKILLRGG